MTGPRGYDHPLVSFRPTGHLGGTLATSAGRRSGISAKRVVEGFGRPPPFAPNMGPWQTHVNHILRLTANFPCLRRVPPMHLSCRKSLRPGGFEPPTLGSEVRCSIQLSYGRVSSPSSRGAVRVSSRRGTDGRTPRAESRIREPIPVSDAEASPCHWGSGVEIRARTARAAIGSPTIGLREPASAIRFRLSTFRVTRPASPPPSPRSGPPPSSGFGSPRSGRCASPPP